jgi:hypothetical protein
LISYAVEKIVLEKRLRMGYNMGQGRISLFGGVFCFKFSDFFLFLVENFPPGMSHHIYR